MRRGITLLEVLVAATLLSVGLLATLQVIGRSASSSREVDDRGRALMAARSKMEEILKEPVLQVGTDQGIGVDTSTDYDWQATIENSQHASLVVITVSARNRITGMTVSLSSLRRPDVASPPEGATGTGATSTPGTTGQASPGGAL